MTNIRVQATTAQFPGFSFEDACAEIAKGVVEGFGPVHMEHVQLCPQASDFVDEQCIVHLQSQYPNTKFRLHANVRIDPILRIYDASRYSKKNRWYYERLAELSSLIGASGYSLHAGYRKDATLEEMKANVTDIQSFFPCDVMVEGMYPDDRKDWLVKNWEEYQWLMESGLLYALDVSHLNILKKRLHKVDLGLLRDMILHPNCKEIHLSHNYGNHDSHMQLKAKAYENSWWREIWLETMEERINYGIDIPVHFTEGRCSQRSPNMKNKRRKPPIS